MRSLRRVKQRVRELTGSDRNGVKDVRVLIRDLNPVLRGWGNCFRTENAAERLGQVDRHVTRRLTCFTARRRSRNLRPGEFRAWTEDFFSGHELHRLRGTVRYP